MLTVAGVAVPLAYSRGGFMSVVNGIVDGNEQQIWAARSASVAGARKRHAKLVDLRIRRDVSLSSKVSPGNG